jgi:hypothetical protein
MALEQAERGRQKRLNDEQECSRTSRKAGVQAGWVKKQVGWSKEKTERLKGEQDRARAERLKNKQAGVGLGISDKKIIPRKTE